MTLLEKKKQKQIFIDILKQIVERGNARNIQETRRYEE